MNGELIFRHKLAIAAHRDSVERSYLAALEDGMEDPAVMLVLDVDDHTAKAFLADVGRHDQIPHVVYAQRRGRRIGLAYSVPRTTAVKMLTESHPGIAHCPEIPLENGYYWAIVVTDDSASAIKMPPVSAVCM
jgi:hypothetical protein